MFIDIHAHAYRVKTPGPCNFCTAEELIAEYDRLGIDIGVLMPIVSPEIYLPQTNEDILEMVERYPNRFRAFCNIDPRALTNSPAAPLGTLLSYYRERGAKGVGEVMPNLPLKDPRVQNLLYHAQQQDMPVTFDGSDGYSGDFGIIDDPGLPQLEHTLQSMPNLRILGHGPVFWSEIGRLKTPGERSYFFSFQGEFVGRMPSGRIDEEGVVPTLFRRYSNLLGDLSDCTAYNAFARDDVYGPAFMEEFQDRLYFGTDFVCPGMPVPLIELLQDWRDKGKITKSVFDKISHENAAKLLDIEL
jgi:predicted TIM-barrel fold metal-dependent hydrolase